MCHSQVPKYCSQWEILSVKDFSNPNSNIKVLNMDLGPKLRLWFYF